MSSESVATPRSPVVILFNQPSAHTRTEDRTAELGVLEAVSATAAGLTRAGFAVESLGLGDDLQPLVDRLRGAPAVVLNFCESYAGRSAGESHVAALLELLAAPYTGSPPEAISLCLNKVRTKRLLAGCGLPTPPFFELHAEHLALDDGDLEKQVVANQVRWPAVVKPACEDASQGVEQSSVVKNVTELRAAVDRVAGGYGFPVLIEQYIPGREFSIAVIEDPEPRALPITEIVFKHSNGNRWDIVTYDAKWLVGGEEDLATEPHTPAELDEAATQQLQRLAIDAIRLTGCRDYARVDLRQRPDGQPFILEVNPNADFSPSGGVVHQLEMAGMSPDEFTVRMIERAAARSRRRADSSEARSSTPSPDQADSPTKLWVPGAPRVELRGMIASDREPIGDLLRSCGNFRPDECAIAIELVDEALATTGDEDYRYIIAELDDRVVGYSCFGPVPLADGVWDLYWIAVDPSAQGKSVGARLQQATERQIKSAGGRMMLAETSSLPTYEAARRFYFRHDFQLLERIADFYRPGDDRLTFGKRL